MAVTGPNTGFKTIDSATGYAQDLGARYVSNDYLIDTYPNISSVTGNITSPGLWAWGSNALGVLGIRDITHRSSPVQVGSLVNWRRVSMKGNHTAALKTDGTLWVWGNNTFGKLGLLGAFNDGSATNLSSPVQVGSLTNWRQISVGQEYTAAIKTDGTLWTWGVGTLYGQLGHGTIANRSSTTIVGTLTNWKQVSAGQYVTAAVKTDGSLWTWGLNSQGQLGHGDTIHRSSPVQVGSMYDWKEVFSIDRQIAAIKTNGTLWMWGNNDSGVLGLGDTTNRSIPVQVGTLDEWRQVSGGNFYTMAVKTNNTLWAWGRAGAVGLGNTTFYSSPVQVGSLTNWKFVSSGSYHMLSIKTDGSIWTCGRNNIGELGQLDAGVHRSSPVQVGLLTNWKAVASGANSSMAISDGSY